MSINQQALDKIDQLGLDAVHKLTGSIKAQVALWVKNQSVPGKFLDAILEAELPTEEEVEPEPEVVEQTTAAVSPMGTQAMLYDLNDRLEAVEKQIAQFVANSISERVGSNSLPRSYNGGLRGQLGGTPPPNPAGYMAGVKTGRAPTREQANNSVGGRNVRTSQPAQPRPAPAPGQYRGNTVWNQPKVKAAK